MRIKKVFLPIVTLTLGVICALATDASSQGGSWTYAGDHVDYRKVTYAIITRITITITQRGKSFGVTGKFSRGEIGTEDEARCPILGRYVPATSSRPAHISATLRCGGDMEKWGYIDAVVKSPSSFEVVVRYPSKAVMMTVLLHSTGAVATSAPALPPTQTTKPSLTGLVGSWVGKGYDFDPVTLAIHADGSAHSDWKTPNVPSRTVEENWSECVGSGGTATCHFTSIYKDVDKTSTRNGIATITQVSPNQIHVHSETDTDNCKKSVKWTAGKDLGTATCSSYDMDYYRH
jgi:hypothetical protein